MKDHSNVLLFVALLLATAASALGQTQGGGGAAAGIGKVYEAAGRSAAARGLQDKMSTTLTRAIARQKATRAKTPTGSGASRPRRGAVPAPVRSEPVNSATTFRPDPQSDNMAVLADSMGTNDSERAQLRQLFSLTREAFEKEVAAKGRGNNIAAAFTFFIASTVMVYHDDPEPSDQAIDKLWDSMDATLSESPEMAGMSDADKQMIYDMLVAFGGFVLAGNLEAKSSGNADSRRVFKELSGVLIQNVLKTDPAKLRFTNVGLDMKN